MEFGCEWGIGLNSNTVLREVITDNLFDADLFVYEPSEPAYTALLSDLNFSYDLQGLFLDLMGPFALPVDCQDVSNFLVTVWHGLGIEGVPLRLDALSPPGYPGLLSPFRTHTTAPIGSDPTSDSIYVFFNFDFHQVAFDDSGDNAFDASLAHRYDLQGNSYRRPAKSWAHEDYFQSEAGQVMYYPPLGTTSNYLGLARNYAANALPYGEQVLPYPRSTNIQTYAPPDN